MLGFRVETNFATRITDSLKPLLKSFNLQQKEINLLKESRDALKDELDRLNDAFVGQNRSYI